MNTKRTVTFKLDQDIFKETKIQLIKNETNNLSLLIENLLKEWLIKQK